MLVLKFLEVRDLSLVALVQPFVCLGARELVSLGARELVSLGPIGGRALLLLNELFHAPSYLHPYFLLGLNNELGYLDVLEGSLDGLKRFLDQLILLLVNGERVESIRGPLLGLVLLEVLDLLEQLLEDIELGLVELVGGLPDLGDEHLSELERADPQVVEVVEDSAGELGHAEPADVLDDEGVDRLHQLADLGEEDRVFADFGRALEVRGGLQDEEDIEVVQVKHLPLEEEHAVDELGEEGLVEDARISRVGPQQDALVLLVHGLEVVD
mmetsp:Transcript_15020/g.25532  ORF Transcript_15020/g.25532 Transcript_15020/m.25532 type:complete len:270 (+) Transcript_15020:217-1026(+)